MKAIEKQKAIQLRKQGYSLSEIAKKTSVSKGTVSIWVRDVTLSSGAKKQIEARLTYGQIASRRVKKLQTAQKEVHASLVSKKIINALTLDVEAKTLLCALIYYCEGVKSIRDVRFTNSDPMLVKAFLKLFRESFVLDEKKFRVCVHLHTYHNHKKQLKFWSKTSSIPLSQFIKPFQKKSTGLYKKEGYQGCASIRYGSATIARELKAIAFEYMQRGL